MDQGAHETTAVRILFLIILSISRLIFPFSPNTDNKSGSEQGFVSDVCITRCTDSDVFNVCYISVFRFNRHETILCCFWFCLRSAQTIAQRPWTRAPACSFISALKMRCSVESTGESSNASNARAPLTFYDFAALLLIKSLKDAEVCV